MLLFFTDKSWSNDTAAHRELLLFQRDLTAVTNLKQPLFLPQCQHLSCARQLQDQSYSSFKQPRLLPYFSCCVRSVIQLQQLSDPSCPSSPGTGKLCRCPDVWWGHALPLFPATSSCFSATSDQSQKVPFVEKILKGLEQHTKCFAHDIKRIETFR